MSIEKPSVLDNWSPTAKWGGPRTRRYSTGVDRGMIYVDGVGVPWSGLTKVGREGASGEVGKNFIDGRLYRVSVPTEDFVGSVEAFTYPDEFDQCIGNVQVDSTGLIVHGQPPRPFDLCYRSFQGDALDKKTNYTLHFVYGCMAIDKGHEHTTINDSPEAGTFSFEVYGIPTNVEGHKPSSYFSIGTKAVDPLTLDGLERVLYGVDGSTPTLPSAEEIRSYLND